jgi:SHS2 domain-containing protein
VDPSYEFFDHTADMGIRVRAPTLPGLILPAGEALYAVIGQLLGRGDTKAIGFDFVGDDAAGLLRDYLAELLTLVERDARVVAAADVTAFTDDRLTVTAHTRALDNQRSVFHREVKAITYHELDIRTIPGGLEATFIVDI